MALQGHAHLATLHYLSYPTTTSLSALALALKHFCRAVELNDSYLRGFYGLKLVTSKLLPLLDDSTSTTVKRAAPDDDDIPLPSPDAVRKLEEIATRKLAKIVRAFKGGRKDGAGYDEAEVAAARELLGGEGKTER